MAIRGQNVSGRIWKEVQTERSSALGKKNKNRIGWQKRQELIRKDGIVKQIQSEINSEKQQKKDKEKQDRIERKKRKEENERKAEVVQKLSAAKVKRMKKKQLRNLRKA